MLETRLAFIGAGSMGGAIARGLVCSGTVSADKVQVCDPNEAVRSALAAEGIRCHAGCEDLLATSHDVVVLAVKPQVLPSVVKGAQPLLSSSQLVVSIAAGVTIDTLEELLPEARVVRVMPNLPLQVRSGATAVCAGSLATAEDVELVRQLFAALGSAQVMSEAQLDVAGAVTGCGPAFFALLVDDLTRAGVRNGLPAAACREMVLATMRGTAQQLLDSGEHPRAYMEKVTSPGGTTAAALEAMEYSLFCAASEGVDAALERTRELQEA